MCLLYEQMGRAVSSLGGLPAGSPPLARVDVGDDYTAQVSSWLLLVIMQTAKSYELPCSICLSRLNGYVFFNLS